MPPRGRHVDVIVLGLVFALAIAQTVDAEGIVYLIGGVASDGMGQLKGARA